MESVIKLYAFAPGRVFRACLIKIFISPSADGYLAAEYKIPPAPAQRFPLRVVKPGAFYHSRKYFYSARKFRGYF